MVNLDGDASVAIELLSDLPQRFILERNLSLEPGDGGARVHRARQTHLASDLNLVAGAHPERGRWQRDRQRERRRPRVDRHGALNDRDPDRFGSAVDVKLRPDGKDLRIAGRDPKSSLARVRYLKECLSAVEVNHPLAARVMHRDLRIGVQMQHTAVREYLYALLAVRRAVGPRQP